MRLFLAFALSDAVRGALEEVQAAFRRAGVRGSYTPPENLHLTLAFIGEYPDPEPVMDALQNVHFRPVRLTLDRLGAFDSVWWAGLKENGELQRLTEQLRRALAEAGIPYDRKRFSPHITLIRSPRWERPVDLGAAAVRKCSMHADTVLLMRSTRGKHGMIYTPVGALPAGEAPETENDSE